MDDKSNPVLKLHIYKTHIQKDTKFATQKTRILIGHSNLTIQIYYRHKKRLILQFQSTKTVRNY